jgi:TctA family transporter
MFIGILFRLPGVALSAQFAMDEEKVTRKGVSGQATEPFPQPAT